MLETLRGAVRRLKKKGRFIPLNAIIFIYYYYYYYYYYVYSQFASRKLNNVINLSDKHKLMIRRCILKSVLID